MFLQRQRFLEGQKVQRQEKREQHAQDLQEELEWDRNRIAQARLGSILETRETRRRAGQDLDLVDENKRLAEDQRGRKNFLDHELYTNQPSREYFAQFNTTTR